MRILVLTNFYPPHSLGGMGLSCHETVQALQDRGHTVRVLTSKHGARKPTADGDVARVLNLEMELSPLRNAWRILLRRQADLAESRQALREAIAAFDAEVLFIWGMWNLPRQLAADAERLMQGRVLYRFADYWPTLPPQHVSYWRATGRNLATRVLRRALAPIALALLGTGERIDLQYPHAYCVSEAVRAHMVSKGVPISHATVIHSGIDLSRFAALGAPRELRLQDLSQVLYVGRLSIDKGLLILLEAMKHLLAGNSNASWELTLAGGGDSTHVSEIRTAARRMGLADVVTFLGERPSSEIPGIMARHGVVAVPSTWVEPLPRVAMEAMAAGCLVIASRIGGLPEVIDHGRTGILVEPGDSDELARALEIQQSRPGFARRMAKAGRSAAVERFSVDRMVELVERALLEAAGYQEPIANGLVNSRPVNR